MACNIELAGEILMENLLVDFMQSELGVGILFRFVAIEEACQHLPKKANSTSAWANVADLCCGAACAVRVSASFAQSVTSIDMKTVRQLILGNDLYSPRKFLPQALGEDPCWRDLMQEQR